MSAFLWAAALMALGALSVIVLPLLKRPSVEESPAGKSALLAALALPLLAAWLYTQWSSWPWHRIEDASAGAQTVAPEVAGMVEGLAARLARDGGRLEDWQMLGRSRVQLGQYDLAAEAYAHAYRLSGGSDVSALTSYAEALVLADPDALLADAGDLFERALALAPSDEKSLWYGGLAAFGRHQYALARDRWQALIDRDPPPPEEVRQILAERVALAAAQLAGTPAEGGAPAAAPAAAGQAPVAPSAARTVVVEVSVAPALAAQVDAAAPLFVLARTPGGGGPPLAVARRRAGELPLSVELSDADAMVPGRTISSAGEIEIVARIALGGQPMAQPGDLYGSVRIAPGASAPARIEIDRVQQ